MLEERVRGAVEAAALGAGAAEDVVGGAAGAVRRVDVFQVVVVARQVQLHAVALQQRLHVFCKGIHPGFPGEHLGPAWRPNPVGE